MDEMPVHLPTPNFDVMIQHLQGFTDEFGHCRNLPSVDTGAAVLDAINGINAQLEQLNQNQRQLSAQVDDVSRDLGNKIERLGQRLGYSDLNSMIRLENSSATRSNAEITPLVNVETGEDITPFPATVGDVDAASAADINRILSELGLPTNGTARAKKRRLNRAIGLTLQKR
ncbi:hypothetical protein BHE90_016878 [Fusarium euwallaceae]|uniref:SAP domain-containing protein n=2 Tax=Fusarium solani species complex TaxID=232080 RepID=A0A3M2QZE8_9HYPO|nr:hypothetical protein CDV36_016148 [Fusarium kuroshium]RTE68743.1 hypothetical protein BHE90_016878 [Fusarium euwallaceae]